MTIRGAVPSPGSAACAAIARLIQQAPAALTAPALLAADWIETPIGTMIAVADQERLHLLEFLERKALPGELARLRARTGASIGFGAARPLAQIAAELAAYFNGEAPGFATPLALAGSSFTCAVWHYLRTIPPGTTMPYGAVAAALGRPNAPRAAARANGANQIAIVIPCHRVLGADGALTGYGGGLWRKRWLIAHEEKFAPPRPLS